MGAPFSMTLTEFEADIWNQTVVFLKEPLRMGKRRWLRNAGGEVYLRMGNRVIGGKLVPSFEIAAIAVEEKLQGKGWFRRYLRLLGTYPLLPNCTILESVNAPKLLKHAKQYWHPLDGCPQTFYLTQPELKTYGD